MTQRSLFDPVQQTAFKPTAKYDAASRTRRLAGWMPANTGPRTSLTDLPTIRSRFRDAGRNDAPMAAATRHIVTDIVGTGIVPRMATDKVSLKKKVMAKWDAFSKNCDADGMLDFNGQLALAVRTVEESGEVLCRLRPRYPEDGLEVPLQVQLIEADLCPMTDFIAHKDMPQKNYVSQGREIDPVGRRVAWWVLRQHPGDGFQGNLTDTGLLYRVPADEMFSVYYVNRPGQLRGVPEGTSVVVKSKMVGDYDDAVVEKAKIQNLYVGVITKQAAGPGAEGYDPLTNLPIEQAGDGQPMVSLQPGATIELAPGEKMDFSNPPATGVGYNDFMRQQFLTIAAGRGLPYEILTGDIVNISDRTLRVIMQQYRRNIEQKQWLTYVPQYCQRIWNAFIKTLVLTGDITPNQVADCLKVEWTPQAWAYIHPTQDVQARVQEIAAGIASRSATISRRGDDPEVVDMQRAEDLKREKALGILPEVVPATGAPAPATTKPAKGTTA